MLITSHSCLHAHSAKDVSGVFIYEQSNDVQGSSTYDSKDVLTSGHGT